MKPSRQASNIRLYESFLAKLKHTAIISLKQLTRFLIKSFLIERLPQSKTEIIPVKVKTSSFYQTLSGRLQIQFSPPN